MSTCTDTRAHKGATGSHAKVQLRRRSPDCRYLITDIGQPSFALTPLSLLGKCLLGQIMRRSCSAPLPVCAESCVLRLFIRLPGCLDAGSANDFAPSPLRPSGPKLAHPGTERAVNFPNMLQNFSHRYETKFPRPGRLLTCTESL